MRKARGSNGTGESIQKRQFFSIILAFSIILVSHLGSVSPFFRDELLAPVLHFVSVGRGEKGLGVYMREARRSTSFKYTTWILAMQLDSHVDPNESSFPRR